MLPSVSFKMLDQIGLNHLLDDGTICFCLVCKDAITKNYPSDRDNTIFQHFQSEDHERNARNLFKMCIPDQKCESRNIRYLDIVNNSEFEVWEQGGEPSYVSKKDNHFVCLICNEEVSKVCRDTDQIKNNLRYHLGSELHLDKVKSCIWWTYHPSLDTNYIALNNIFMYCSFCQKILKSKENSLLEFAANHIEAELKKANSDKASNVKLAAINSSGASETELEETNSDDLKIQNHETNSNDVSNMQLVSMIESTQTITFRSTGMSKPLESSLDNNVVTVKTANSEINLNEITDELMNVGKGIDYEYVDCPICHEKVEVFNDGDASFSMLKHSLKHTDLSFVNYNIECEMQEKSDSPFTCDRCYQQIEVFNKDSLLSYKHHLGNCHPDEGNSLVSVADANIIDYARVQVHCEESDFIGKVFSSLPKSLKEHLNFVALVGENLSCILCNCKLTLSNDITTACDVLQNHFSEFYHKTQYTACLQNNIHRVEDDQEFEENNQLFKGLQFFRGTINQMGSPVTSAENITLEPCNTNKQTLEVPGGKVRTRVQVLNILDKLADAHELVDENKHILDEKKGHFYCHPCDEILRCTHSGSELMKHLNSNSHFTNLKSGIGKEMKRTHAEVLKILRDLSRCSKLIVQNFDDIGEKDGHFYCKRCEEVVMCTRKGKKLIDHLSGLNHGLQLERLAEEQRELRGKARKVEHVYNILWKLASRKSEVSDSIEVLGVKQGHFYCEICDEILECTCSGSKLIEHLRNRKHVSNLSSHS